VWKTKWYPVRRLSLSWLIIFERLRARLRLSSTNAYRLSAPDRRRGGEARIFCFQQKRMWSSIGKKNLSLEVHTCAIACSPFTAPWSVGEAPASRQAAWCRSAWYTHAHIFYIHSCVVTSPITTKSNLKPGLLCAGHSNQSKNASDKNMQMLIESSRPWHIAILGFDDYSQEPDKLVREIHTLGRILLEGRYTSSKSTVGPQRFQVPTHVFVFSKYPPTTVHEE